MCNNNCGDVTNFQGFLSTKHFLLYQKALFENLLKIKLAALICIYGPALNYLQACIFSLIDSEIKAVFDDLPPILDTEYWDNLFAVHNKGGTLIRLMIFL